MRPALIFCALALTACAPPVEPRDASVDRRAVPVDALDAIEPFEEVSFPPVDVPSIDVPDIEPDATAPLDAPTIDAQPDSAPDARDSGSDARDATPDVVCPANGFMDVPTWEPCGNVCCPFIGRCRIDINGRPYCQG
jgi:hypothetical protein